MPSYIQALERADRRRIDLEHGVRIFLERLQRMERHYSEDGFGYIEDDETTTVIHSLLAALLKNYETDVVQYVIKK